MQNNFIDFPVVHWRDETFYILETGMYQLHVHTAARNLKTVGETALQKTERDVNYDGTASWQFEALTSVGNVTK